MDLGRPVAYYPELKQITGSTTATILLCQLLYWTPRTKHKDKWIYKTNYDIEEETGLTYNEQKTAKKKLKENNLISYEVKRLDRTTRYRVREETLNTMWESVKSGSTKPIHTPAVPDGSDEPSEEKNEGSPEEYFDKKWKDGEKSRKEFKDFVKDSRAKKESKNPDLVDGVIDASKSYGMKKAEKISEITLKIEKALKINVSGKYWEDFVEFAYVREKKGEPVGKFLGWLTSQADYEIKFWSPQRMMTFYPQAFIDEDDGDFVRALPKRKKKKNAPMPDSVSNMKKIN